MSAIIKWKNRRGSKSMALVLLLALCTTAPAQEASEYQLKAAFMFNFAKFTEWPDTAFNSSSAPLVVGVIGDDPFGDAINIIQGKRVKDREVVVQRFTDPGSVANCQILFISASEQQQLPAIFNHVKRGTVLTVGEMESFFDNGGVIKFVEVNGKVGFEINAEAVKKADFKLSSQLLKFAKLVRTAG